MAYFVKGNPAIPKPTSLLGASNKAMSEAQKMRMVEKQQRQRMLLEAAKMKMSQEMALRKEQLANMRYQANQQRREEERLDSQQMSFQREVRRITDGANLEPYAQELLLDVVEGQMAASNNFRGSIESANAAVNNIIEFNQTYSRDKKSANELGALNDQNNPLQISRDNATLKNKFLKIDEDSLGVKTEQANFLYGGGFAAGKQLVGAGDLSSVPKIQGYEFTGFDENGAPQYGDQLIDISKSKYYHDQGNTGMMVTPMGQYFGESFAEIGMDLQSELKTHFDGGEWREQSAGPAKPIGAREYVERIIRTPFGVKGRAWRNRSLAGNVTHPDNPEASNGIYFKYQDEPELREQLIKMVQDYDLFDANGQPKRLYEEYKTDIDSAIKLAVDDIVVASNFDNYRVPNRSGGQTPSQIAAEHRQQMISSRRATIDESGAIGSFYMPEFLRTKPINVTSDNSEAVRDFDERKEAFRQGAYDRYIDAGRTEASASQQADADALAEFPDRDRPKPTTTYRFDRFEVFPDGVAEDGTTTIVLKNATGELRAVNSKTSSEWQDVTSRLSTEGIEIADLMKDMNQNWSYPQAELDRLNIPQEENQDQGSTGPSMTYPEWKASQPEGVDTSLTAYVAAMNL